MNDIFVSYAREDRAQAELLAAALEAHGWSVFWDRLIPSGQTWRSFVGKALSDARCVVVAWSSSSIESHWVHEEADDARQRGILVPVLFENVTPPLGFRSVQAADLTLWDGEHTAVSFARFVTDLGRLLGAPPSRPDVETETFDDGDDPTPSEATPAVQAAAVAAQPTGEASKPDASPTQPSAARKGEASGEGNDTAKKQSRRLEPTGGSAEDRIAWLAAELISEGFERSPRSARLLYHPTDRGLRVALGKKAVRLEKRNHTQIGQERPWQLVDSWWSSDMEGALVEILAAFRPEDVGVLLRRPGDRAALTRWERLLRNLSSDSS